MDERAAIEDRLRPFFASRSQNDIAAVYLFGSVARGTARPDSDVDVGVLLVDEPPHTLDGLLLRLEGDLERLLGARVQVVVLNTAPCDLVYRVLRDGRLILDRNPSARIRFEVRTRNERFDLEPILRRYRRLDTATGSPR